MAAAAVAARRPGRPRGRRLMVVGSLVWLAASAGAAREAIDPPLAVAWTIVLLLGLCLLLTGVDRPALAAGMAIGVAASLPLMLFQAAMQTTWPVAAIQGWTGGELTGAVRGAAVLGSVRWLRPYGLAPHPNIAGGLAAITSVLLAAVWFRERRMWQLALVAAAFGETLLTFSRGAWLAAVFGLAALALARRQNLRPLLLAVAIPVLLFVSLLGGLALQRTEASGTLEGDSISQRIYLVQTAILFWREHALLGIGPAQFSQQEVELYGPSFIPEPVHNGLFLVLAETGLAGLAGAALVAAGIARRAIKERDWDTVAIGLAVLPPLMLDHYLLTSAVGLMLMAAVLGRGNLECGHQARQSAPRSE